MKTNCKIEISVNSKEDAEKLLGSIKVDDYSFVRSKTDENTLIAEIKSDSIESLLHTVDDYLSCVSVAEKIIDKK